jgi:hypothetical protein
MHVNFIPFCALNSRSDAPYQPAPFSTCSRRAFGEYLLMQKTLLNFADDLAPFARRMVSFLNHKSRITHHA